MLSTRIMTCRQALWGDMKILLLGPDGLVGSAFARYFEKAGLEYLPVRRRDATAVVGTECDLLISCIGNANKGRANSDPAFDFAESVASISQYIHGVRARRVVHISSVDVYSDPSDRLSTSEDVVPEFDKQHTYGFHKYMAETVVRRFARRWHVLRLPGLVGPNLTKNPVFDHFTKGKKLFVDAESRLNFLHTDFIAETAMHLVKQVPENETFNLAARNSIYIRDLPRISGLENEFEPAAAGNVQAYDINTKKIARYVDLPSSEECVRRYKEDVGLG